MNHISAEEVRAAILFRLHGRLTAMGIDTQNVPDDFDLLTEGVIDSQGVVEMIAAVEQGFHTQIELEDLDPEDITVIGPLCRYVAERATFNADLQTPVGKSKLA